MSGSTINFSLTLPTVGGDSEVWATYTNANWVTIDSILKVHANTLLVKQGSITCMSQDSPIGSAGVFTALDAVEGLYGYDAGGNTFAFGLQTIPAFTVLANANSGGNNTPNSATMAQMWAMLSSPVTRGAYSSNQNNLDLLSTEADTYTTYRISSTGAIDLTGIVAPSDARIVFLLNVGSNTITLKNSSGSSSAANRFKLNADYALKADGGAIIFYDFTSARWRMLSGTP